MIENGKKVRIVELKARNPKSWIFSLKADEEKSTHLGQISHNTLMEKDYGDVVHLSHGTVAILKPSPKDFLKAFKLKTQIFGLPLLYVYVFGIWCLLIGLAALATLSRSNEHKDDSDDAGG